MGPIDVQRRIARQKGERLARRARSHGGFSALDQSLDAGFKPCFSKIKLLRDHRDLRASSSSFEATPFAREGICAAENWSAAGMPLSHIRGSPTRVRREIEIPNQDVFPGFGL